MSALHISQLELSSCQPASAAGCRMCPRPASICPGESSSILILSEGQLGGGSRELVAFPSFNQFLLLRACPHSGEATTVGQRIARVGAQAWAKAPSSRLCNALPSCMTTAQTETCHGDCGRWNDSGDLKVEGHLVCPQLSPRKVPATWETLNKRWWHYPEALQGSSRQ